VTEEEKQRMIAQIMREEQPDEMGGEMIPLGAREGGQGEYSQYQNQQQGYSGMSPLQMRPTATAAPASGAGSGLTAAEAASFSPAMAPESLAIGGANAPVAQMGPAVAGNVGGSGGGAAAGGGGMAAAAPFGVAAAIIGNEMWAKKSGRRPNDNGEYAKQLLTGKVLENDANALGDKIGGPIGDFTKNMGEMGNPEGIYSNFKKALQPWEWF
jgi:hypothetical protein